MTDTPADGPLRDDILVAVAQQRHSRNLRLLNIYNYYRVVVGCTLLLFYMQGWFITQLGSFLPNLFFATVAIYTLINIATALGVSALPDHLTKRQLPAIALVTFDILMLTAMLFESGGANSGLAPFLLVAVTAGAIVVHGKWSTFLAALATIAVLYQETYLVLTDGAEGALFEAGVLGALFFAFSLLIQNLSNRLRQNELKNLTQAAELADLERINKQIIQRMRTGIVVVDTANQVRTYNQAALSLLGYLGTGAITKLPPPLEQALNRWREDAKLRTPPFQADSNGPQIQVNFASVRQADPQSDVTIFIEDTGEVLKQAQQLKLAELGRLSASIAHEIRNPLGAISHAAQLLQESSNLDKGDERLTAIIHSHTRRMNDVVENVLDMSRRAPPSPTRVRLLQEVQTFAKEFLESNPERAGAVQISVEVTPDHAEVRIDRRQLQQVLTNLVTNAIRHGGTDSSLVAVRLVGGIDEKTERPFLNVLDNGPGVDAEQVALLFQPFHTNKLNGTGLGLYLCRELCEANEARLTYITPPEGGACFRILFAHPDRISP